MVASAARLVALCVLLAVPLATTACDRSDGDAEESAEAQVEPLAIELTLVEADVGPDGEPGSSTATLVVQGRTASLEWAHSGALARVEGEAPSGSLELDDAQLERLRKILDKTGLGASDVEVVEETTSGRAVRVDGTFELGEGPAREVHIALDKATPLTERGPDDDTAVFTVEATRALVGEVARFLARRTQ